MIQLSEQELKFIEENEELLKYDKFQKFYDVISNNLGYDFEHVGILTDFFMLDCNINLWEYLDEIPKCMFYESIQSHVVIPNKYKYISNDMFVGSNIQEIVIPSKIDYIGVGAFYGCRDLTKVILNEGLERIGMYAFEYCPNLKEIYIPESVVKIQNFSFDERYMKKITTPKRSENNRLKYPEEKKDFYEKVLEYI